MKRFCQNMAALCALILPAFGCSLGSDAEIPIPSSAAPELLSVEVVSETAVDFEFSAPVRRAQVSFEPSLKIASIGEGRTVRVLLGQSLEPGAQVSALILAEDERGNAFSETAFFEMAAAEGEEPPAPEGGGEPGSEDGPQEEGGCQDGEGPSDCGESQEPPAPGSGDEPGSGDGPQDEGGAAWAPWLVINELRTEFNGNASSLNRVEFVEMKALSAGNLDGLQMRIYRSGGGAAPATFDFPYRAVAAGEFVVLYLRSQANREIDTSPAAHNFWREGATSVINQNSAVYALDRDGRVLSAVMLSSSADPAWWDASSRRSLAAVAGFLHEQGAWKSASGGAATPADAVGVSGIGSRVITLSVSRDEGAPPSGTAADWYISAAVTPGMPNSPERH